MASDRELTNRCAGRSGARLGIWHTWVGTVQKGDQQGSPGLVGHVVMCYRLTHVDRGHQTVQGFPSESPTHRRGACRWDDETRKCSKVSESTLLRKDRKSTRLNSSH